MSMPSTCGNNVSIFFNFIDTLDHEPANGKQGLAATGAAYYEEFGSAPPIRKFAKYLENAVFKLRMTGPMKPITKYGGLPKPTGCV